MNFPFRVEYLISFNPEEIPSNPCGSSKVKVPPLSTRKKVSPILKLYFYFFFQKCENAKRREIRACNGDRLRTRLARFFRRDAGIYTEGRLVHRRAIARRVPLESTSRVVGGEIEAVLLISSMGR